MDLRPWPHILLDLQKLAAAIKDFEKAYTYQEQYYEEKNKISDVKFKSSVAELEKKYETEKKNREITTAQIENLQLKSKLNYSALAILLISLVGVLYYLFQLKKKQRNKAKIDEMERKLLALQMNHLIVVVKYQLNW